MRFQIVRVERGRNRGRFGWVVYCADFWEQGATFPTEAEARADVAKRYKVV